MSREFQSFGTMAEKALSRVAISEGGSNRSRVSEDDSNGRCFIRDLVVFWVLLWIERNRGGYALICCSEIDSSVTFHPASISPVSHGIGPFSKSSRKGQAYKYSKYFLNILNKQINIQTNKYSSFCESHQALSSWDGDLW